MRPSTKSESIPYLCPFLRPQNLPWCNAHCYHIKSLIDIQLSIFFDMIRLGHQPWNENNQWLIKLRFQSKNEKDCLLVAFVWNKQFNANLRVLGSFSTSRGCSLNNRTCFVISLVLINRNPGNAKLLPSI